MFVQLPTASGSIFVNMESIFYITVSPYEEDGEHKSRVEMVSINGNRHSPLVACSAQELEDTLRTLHYGNPPLDSTADPDSEAYGVVDSPIPCSRPYPDR